MDVGAPRARRGRVAAATGRRRRRLPAGQNAVAEVAGARRPAVVIADPRPFAEQEHTVEALERAGLAATATAWPARLDWPGLVARAQELGGAGWASWTDGRGAERAADAILAVAQFGSIPGEAAR